MTTTTQPAPPVAEAQAQRRRPNPPRLLEVVRVTDLTPHMRRVTLGGPEIADFPHDKAGSHVKVFIPRPGQAKPVLPTLTENGPVWPPADERPFARTYTIRRFNPAAGELDLDFVLHGDNGPASVWAINAKPGDVIGIAGPGPRGPITQTADWYIFAGDETAIPAISAHLERLPAAAQGVAFIEVADAGEEQEIVYDADIALTWLHRNGVPAGHSPVLIERVLATPLPTGAIFAWVAAEATATVTIRDYWRNDWGLPRSQVEAIPFWKAGVAEEIYHEERHHVMDEEA
jgi:NADPH-dependent ferric siderophore reductase